MTLQLHGAKYTKWKFDDVDWTVATDTPIYVRDEKCDELGKRHPLQVCFRMEKFMYSSWYDKLDTVRPKICNKI